MIEFRADGSIPGPDKYGRIYKVVDLNTGEIGYNYSSSDLPGLDPYRMKIIKGYDTFRGWVTDIIDIKEVQKKCREMNDSPAEYIETPHTLLVKRVEQRLRSGNNGIVDGYRMLDDMLEMFHDIQGRLQRQPLEGWPRCDGSDQYNGSVIINEVP